jgi:hypothetical protein
MLQTMMNTRVVRWRLFIAVVAIANVVLVVFALGTFWAERTLDAQNFAHNSGNCFVYPITLFTPSDTMESTASRVKIFEDDTLLEPGHAQHEAIRQIGQGRFSHWGEQLYMSSSDNSDPRTNGRVYKIVYPLRPPSSVIGISLLLTAFVLPFAAPTRERRKTIYKRFHFPIMAISFSAVLLLIPMEMFLRTDYSKEHVFGAFQRLPSKLQPTVNEQGYRDREHERDNYDGSIRIVILGDSFTFGDGVADDEIYPRILQGRVGGNVEIITLARDGWGTADELAALRRDGFSYHPDIVVVGVVTNDPSPRITEPQGQSAPWIVFQSITPNMILFRLLDFRLNVLVENSGWKYGYTDWERDLYDPGKRYRGAWERTVMELSQELLLHRISAYAFLLIGPAQANELSAWKFKILDDVFSKAGFSTHNLLESYTSTFQGVTPTSLFALPDDPHPGREVHKFYANELWKVLKPETEKRVKSLGR